MVRLNTIHDIIYGSLRPMRRDNLQKPDDFWREKTVAREKRPTLDKSLFFSARLRCYQSLIDSDVDHFVEETERTVKDTKSPNLSLLKMKDTIETVEGFAKAAIREQKTTGIVKDDILGISADLFERQVEKETFIIMDYIVVALARCYFSIQAICDKALPDDRRLDLSTFCTSMLGRQRLSLLADIRQKDLCGDTKAVAEIRKASPSRKKIKDDLTPYTVKYNYLSAERAVRLNGVMQLLVAEGWIAADTTPENFFNFFEGKPLHCNIKWTGSAAALGALLNNLTVQPFIEMQKGCTKALVAKNQFGKTFDYRGTTDDENKNMVNIIIDLLNPRNKIPNRNAPTDDDDNDDPLMKAQLREAGFEARKRGHWAKK